MSLTQPPAKLEEPLKEPTTEHPLERAHLQDGSRLARVPFFAGIAVVFIGVVVTRILSENVPEWSKGTFLESLGDAIEYPVYAIALGLILNAILSAFGLQHQLSAGFRTEFFIKTGLVLLGGTVVFTVIIRAAGPAILQALTLITGVFLFTWWLGGKLGLEDRLRALLASALSICGVSAAIAAAGAVKAKKEDLAYTASLVILFALPSIFLLPWLSSLLGLSPEVTGAWIGGNIDTTAAVTAAAAVVGEQTVQVASIVKMTQNALIGFVAVALTSWFALKVERNETAEPLSIKKFWQRFPKFVLGFLAASLIITVAAEFASEARLDNFDAVIKGFRDYFLIAAFVSIGLEFKVSSLKQAGTKPLAVFAAGTAFNIVLGLALAVLLFSNFAL